MTKKIVFASNNSHKLEELRRILGTNFEVMSLADIGCHDDIPETAATLAGNAEIKARWVKEKYGYDCFADDTGLMVDALGGEPGVHSARYAADAGDASSHDASANTRLLLRKLEGVADRSAHFATVIALIEGNELHLFEGRVDGVITTQPCGEGGFGYDPVFRPDGSELTFAQMSADAKNAVSHRGRAVARLAKWLAGER